MTVTTHVRRSFALRRPKSLLVTGERRHCRFGVEAATNQIVLSRKHVNFIFEPGYDPIVHFRDCEPLGNGPVDLAIAFKKDAFPPFHENEVLRVPEEGDGSVLDRVRPKFRSRFAAQKMDDFVLDFLCCIVPDFEQSFAVVAGEYPLGAVAHARNEQDGFSLCPYAKQNSHGEPSRKSGQF